MTSSARGSSGASTAAASRASGENEDKSGGGSRAGPEHFRHAGGDFAGFALGSRRGLELHVCPQIRFLAKSDRGGEGGYGFADVLIAEPAAGIQVGDFRITGICDRSAAVGGAVQHFIVQQDRRAVLGENDVELHAHEAQVAGQLHTRQCVFRCQESAATVGDHAGVGPEQVREGHWPGVRGRGEGQIITAERQEPSGTCARGPGPHPGPATMAYTV